MNTITKDNNITSYGSQIKILEYTSNPASVVHAAASISTKEGNALDTWETSKNTKIKSLVPKVLCRGHLSTLEHVNFNIAFTNVSVIMEQFIIEHRLASFTVKSRRYVDYGSQGYIMPELKGITKEDKLKFKNHIEALFDFYTEMVSKGIPKEDARFILPYAFKSNFYCTVNGRELLKIIYGMLYGRGSKYPELAEAGTVLLHQATTIFPECFELLGEIGSFTDSLEEYFTLSESSGDKIEVLNTTTGYFNLLTTQVVSKESSVTKKYFQRIAKTGRSRLLELGDVIIRFNGISLATLTHLTRHRMQSLFIPDFTQITANNSIIVPETLKKDKELHKKYLSLFEYNRDIRRYLENGLVNSDTVYFLPAGVQIDVISKMNLRELRHFFALRMCNKAQWEIREYAYELYAKLHPAFPDILQYFGPSCFLTGRCPEEPNGCKRMKEVFEKVRLINL